MKHARFIARTVMVHKGNVEEAMAVLNKFLPLRKSFQSPFLSRKINYNVPCPDFTKIPSVIARDGLFEEFRRIARYEKPCEMRRRVNFTKAKCIYNEEMTRRLSFLMRVNRVDAYPGCS